LFYHFAHPVDHDFVRIQIVNSFDFLGQIGFVDILAQKVNVAEFF
jgi:hypothetical protein